MKGTLLSVLLLFSGVLLYSESITVINRTGGTIELIQSAPAGSDQWGDDMIPGSVLPDRDSVILDLIGDSPWAFRMLDSYGVVYVLYDIQPAVTGKLTVGPENQARLAIFAGAEREITITNRTGSPISSLNISSVNDGGWGADVLSGRYIRDGESAAVTLEAVPGALSFDIRFTLISGGDEISYEKQSVILTDGAALILSIREGE